MTIDDVLGQLVGKSPRRLLEELSVLGKAFAASDRARPEIELYLTGGAVLRGRLVDVADDRNGPVAVLQREGAPNAPSVSYVLVEQVAAVTVIDATLLVRVPVGDAATP